MNEQTEQNINATMEWVGQAVGKSEGFILEQAPLYAQEVVKWHFVGHSIKAVAFTVLFAVAAIFFMKALKKGRTIGWGTEAAFPSIMGATISFTVMLMVFVEGKPIEHTQQAIKAKVAPRVIIIEHIKAQLP